MRLSPRIKTDIPIKIDVKSEALISDICLDGAFLKANPHTAKDKTVGDNLIMKYNLPRYGAFEHHGKILRKGISGVAVSFYNIDIATKTKLWEYLSNSIADFAECPYCGEKYNTLPAVCKTCGWELTFNSPGYFEYRERMSLLKKMYLKTDNLGLDQLQRLINFIDVDILKTKGSEEFQEFVGTSDAMLDVFSKIRKVASTDIPIIILGESGTGKELTALAVHERSSRKEIFVPINCAAIPEHLLEAELFGYERGAFTGAYTSKKGKFEHADGGTLFLDEIGELSSRLQAKLLRFLDDKVVERIGATVGKKVDVRLIAATNRDLGSAIAKGEFRNDLYYRLAAFTITLPPVRERDNDSVVLSKYFLNRFSKEMGLTKTFTKEVIEAVRSYNWPGNVREIINKVRSAIVMSSENLITPQDLNLDDRVADTSNKASLKELKDTVEKQRVIEALNRSGNNISLSAKVLGLSRPSIYNLMKKHGIKI